MKPKFIDPNSKLPLISKERKLFRADGSIVNIEKGIIDLRPSKIDCIEKINEDKIYEKDSMLGPSEIFFELISKKGGYIKNFLERWLPKIEPYLQSGSVFLEVGGGFNYISAIVKHKYRNVIVCASDISPKYLQKKSIPLAKYLFEISPEYYIALDAENMPFENNSVDIIWTHNSLHHFNGVPKFLYETSRVLKKNGILVALDTAEPYFRRGSFKKQKQTKAKEYGIIENSYTIFDWRKISRVSPFKVEYTPSRKIKGKTLKMFLNSFYSFGIVFSNVKFK